MLFTHFGVSGPLMLSASALVGEEIKKKPLSLRIDLKPALDQETIDKRLVGLFAKNKNKQYKNKYCILVGMREKQIDNTPAVLIFIPDDVLVFPDEIFKP